MDIDSIIDSSTFVRLTDSEFEYIVQFVSQRYGIDLSQKRRLIEARLAGELKTYGFTSYEQYIAMLKSNPASDKVDNFINKITTNYSYFNREMEHYDFLMNTIIPALSQAKKSTLKIWSAGCSTGEEPYNIAMAVDSALGFKRNLWNVSITATDVSTRALSVAKKGEYPEAELTGMPEAWKKNYMVKLPNGNYQVKDNIRNVVSFSKFNLMDPFPPKIYDVIFCRNVMIYFKQPTSQAIVKKFYQCLAEGGYLLIGHSETLSRTDTQYKYIRPSIYQKVSKQTSI
ncbi:MAG: protein-glutamate O-methyltransferase CheR [Clostridiales bacterium]|nr:protein-glutamate O-methyltransferase CheR [Clostridiales bacterium]